MQMYDILMIVVLIGTVLFGFCKGMAWQVASLASLLFSYFIALKLSPVIAPMLGDQEPWNRFLAMLIIYVVTSLVIWMLFRVVADVINRVKLREFDRQLGALFGLAKGVLLCIAITLFAVSLLPEEKRSSVLDSKSGFYIAQLLDHSHAIMPEELHDVLHEYIHKAQEKLDPDGGHDDAHTAEEHRQALKAGADGMH